MQLSIYLDDKVVKKLEKRAAIEKRSRSNLIQKLLTDFVENADAVSQVKSEQKTEDSFSLIHLKAIETGIPDLAAEHDHYLYGVSKRG